MGAIRAGHITNMMVISATCSNARAVCVPASTAAWIVVHSAKRRSAEIAPQSEIFFEVAWDEDRGTWVGGWAAHSSRRNDIVTAPGAPANFRVANRT